MIFYSLSGRDYKKCISTIENSEVLFYNSKELSVSTEETPTPITEKERRELLSFYVRLKYILENMACAECQAGRMRSLKKLFNQFNNELMYKYKEKEK